MAVRSPETNSLVTYLKLCADNGEVATYDRMSDLIRIDILKMRSRLNTALKALQSDYNYVASCVPKVGYKFLKNTGVPSVVGTRFERKIKGCVERTQSALSTVDWGKLADGELKEMISLSIRTQAHEQLVKPSFLMAVDKVAATSDRFINSAKEAAKLMKNIG